MPIVKGSAKVETKKKGGKADVEKLLQHTEVHPKGRIQLDPETGRVKNPQNNVLYRSKKKVRSEGKIIGEIDVSVNGGHVLAENSVWRIALRGPSKYHWKVMQDERRFLLGKGDRSAPELTLPEEEEYLYYRVFLKETSTVLSERTIKETDELFYEWLKKQDRSKLEEEAKKLPPAVSPVPAVRLMR